jgi:predicted GIY-YIG superfamily endonuclease
MPAQQLHLFAPPKPLVQRLGEAFFRAAPRQPGVYIMTGRDGLVLYIGQSGNLRQRLASYKNARLDRTPRKVIRLVHAVESITWETCDSPEGARLRENELLRTHRPKFNRLNTWPQAYSFIRLEYDEAGLELSQTREATNGGHLYGAFKAHVTAGYGALLRLTWAAWHQPASHHDFPAQLLASRPPRQYRFTWHPHPAPWSLDTFVRSVHDFLSGVSDDLLELLTEAVHARDGLGPFQRALHTQDLEVLSQFYLCSPRRNHELTRRHNLPNPLILQEQLDDLLVENS